MEGQRNPWRIAFLFLGGLILLGIVGTFAYFFGKGSFTFSGTSSTPSPSPVSELQAPPAPLPTADETEAIKQAIYELVGMDETKVNVTISENIDTHAKGGVVDWGSEVGGGYWIAAKADSGWIGVYAGQSHPTCSQIALYNFPIDMVSECLDEIGNVVTR
ncbi:MAG: hypothetical protein WBD86_03510 [Microgenomates group bacterium]